MAGGLLGGRIPMLALEFGQAPAPAAGGVAEGAALAQLGVGSRVVRDAVGAVALSIGLDVGHHVAHFIGAGSINDFHAKFAFLIVAGSDARPQARHGPAAGGARSPEPQL